MAGALLGAIATHVPGTPVLVTGSAAQYGIGARRPLVETDPTVPLSAYGAQKSVLERAVLAAPLRRDVRVIFTRSFNHIGPGQGADAPAGHWARQIADAEAAGGGTVRTGDLSAVRDFLDVRDVADAYLALVRSAAAGVVNVCSGVPVAVERIIELLLADSEVPITVERDPALVRGVDPPYVVGDTTRLRALTGWTPSIPLKDSASDLLSACRRQRGVALPAAAS
jgi:GDP-4-dehydro-6-deoxy-D-mannose reductase